MDTRFIKVHGLQRSGTNYLTYLIDNNIEDVKTLVNVGGWKHGPYSMPVIGKEVDVAVITKNPYSWLVSVYDYWKNINLGPNLSNVSFEEFVTSKALFESQSDIPYLFRASNPVQYWNNMNHHWITVKLVEHQLCIICYEVLVYHAEEVIRNIAQRCNLKSKPGFDNPINDIVPSGEEPKLSDKAWSKGDYYKNKEYMKRFSPELIRFVNSQLDTSLMSYLHYGLEPATEVDAIVQKSLSLAEQDKHDEAIELLHAAIEKNPKESLYPFNLGSILLTADKPKEAVEVLKKALDLGVEDKAAAYHNLGFAHKLLMDYDKAIECYKKAVELNPAHLPTHNNLGIVQLTLGDWEEGWNGWETRMKINPIYNRIRNQFNKPEWDGQEDLKDKKLLVFNEQGRGDSINFSRYLPMLKDKGAYIIFFDREEMEDLYHNFKGIDYFLSAKSKKVPPFDLVVSLNSLPKLFGTNTSNIPKCEFPYLFPQPITKFPEGFPDNYKDKFKVGISWAGSKIHPQDKQRSCKNSYFKILSSIPNVQLFSLQKKDEDHKHLITDSSFYIDMDDYIRDFNDTANIINKLDLVISVDTANVHLAGALGIPVWNLVVLGRSDFRWLLDKEYTDWYPSMRIFRQKKVGNWDELFKRVYRELKKNVIDKV